MIKFDKVSEAAEVDPLDYSDATRVLDSDEWLYGTTEERIKLIPRGMNAILSTYEADKSRTVPFHNAEGDLVDAPSHNPAKIGTKALDQRMEMSRRMLTAAAYDPDGGLHTDAETGKKTPARWAEKMMDEKWEEPLDVLSDFEPWRAEQDTISDEGVDHKVVGSWEGFVNYANSNNKNGEADIDVNNKQLKAAWARRNARAIFDTKTLGEKMVGEVGGEVVFNEDRMEEAWNIEEALNATSKTTYDKKRILNSYKEMLDVGFADYVNSSAGSVDPVGYALDKVTFGHAGNNSLRDRAMKAMEDPNFSAFEFIKANKEEFDNDEKWLSGEVTKKFRDGLVAFETGAYFLAGLGIEKVAGKNEVSDLFYTPAQEWGWASENDAMGYNNELAFSLGEGFDFHRRDLTELTGQVGSFIAAGGISKLVVSGGVKLAASRAATTASEAALSTGATAEFAASQASLASEAVYATRTASLATKANALTVKKAELATKGLGAKALNQLKLAVTDKTAYLGALQASGAGYGRTFDQVMRVSGDREQAHNAATIDGVSNGLSALIATGVMNRFGMGAEAAFGPALGNKATLGLAQNLKGRIASREGMKAVRESLKSMKGSPELKRQFAKDTIKVLNETARKNGLKGWGIAGGTASETVEEAFDTALSEVFSVMLDDTKTLNNEEWSNIASHWKDYVKAGILGAIGGFGGEAFGSISSEEGRNQILGESEGLKTFKEAVAPLKANVEGFKGVDANKMPIGSGNAVKVAEYIAWDGGLPENATQKQKRDLIKEKSAHLVKQALEGHIGEFYSRGAEDATPENAPTSGDTPSVEGSATGHTKGSPESVVEELGSPLGEGERLADDVEFTPEDSKQATSFEDAEGNTVTVRSVSIINGDRGQVDNAGAEITITKGGKQVSSQTVSAKEAHQVLSGMEAATPTFLGMKSTKNAVRVKNLVALFGSENIAKSLDSQKATMVVKDEAPTERISTPKVEPTEPLPKDSPAPDSTSEAGESKVSPTNEETENFRLAHETEPEIAARTKPGEERTIAYAKRRAAAVELAKTIKKGDKITDPDGEVLIAERDANSKGEVLFEGAKEPINAATYLASSSASNASGERIQEKGSSIERAKSTTESKVSPTKKEPNEQAEPSAPDPSPTPEITTESTQALGDGSERKPSGGGGGVSVDGEAVTGERKEADSTPEVEDSPLASLRKNASSKIKDSRIKIQEKPDDDSGYQEKGGVYWNKKEVIVTDKALAKIAEDESLKSDRARNNALLKLIGPMRENLVVQDAPKLPALSDKEGNTVLTAEDVSTLNKESSYLVDRSDLETISKDEAENEKKGIWRKLDGIKDKLSRTATYFSYTPPKGKVMKIIDGDILTISGDGPAGPSMLILESFKNGTYIFREALVEEINDKRSANSKKKTYKAINEYTKGILTQVAEKFAPYLNKNTGKKLDATSVEALFKEVMGIVSPNASFKVVEKNMSGEKGLYVYANLKGKGTIVVDYAKLAEQFNRQYVYKTISEDGGRFLALDAARKMSSIIDEEIIHIITSRIFKPAEMEGFVNEILDEIEAETEHPYIDLLRDTARERLDKLNNKSTDEQVDAVMMEMDTNELYNIGMELIRKVYQFSNSGFSTESASMQSIRLQAAIKADEDKQTGKKSFIHTLGEMVRRYTDRIRKILWAKFQQKRISDTQRDLLVRLNDAYHQVGIRGDVESAQESVKDDSRLTTEMYEKHLKEDIGSVAMAHSATMSNVREFVKSKYGARLVDLFSIDPKTMRMAVNPYYREELEKSKVVMSDLANFLDDLNGDGDKLILPAYQMAMTSSFLKQQNMDVLRDQLEVAFDDVDLFSGLVDRGNKGYLSDANLWQKVIDAAPDEVVEAELREAFSRAKVEQAGILNDQRAATELAKNRFLQEAFQELEGLEGKNDVQSLKKLVSWIRELNFTGHLGYKGWEGYSDMNQVDRADLLESKRVEVMQKLALMAPTLGDDIALRPEEEMELAPSERVYGPSAEIEKIDNDAESKRISDFLSNRFRNTISGEAGKLLSDFREQKYNEIKLERELARNNRTVDAKILDNFDSAETEKRKSEKPSSTKKVTKEQFNDFVEFIQAVEDYNDSLLNVIERSFGDFGRITKEFGLNYANVSVFETKDGTTEFPETSIQVEPVTSGKGKDVLSANILGRHILKKDGLINDEETTYTTQPERGEFDGVNFVRLPLTKAQEERNAFITAFQTRVESNNKAAARFMYGDYWRAKHTLKIWDATEMEKYEKTGGFSLAFHVDPETEVVDYESPSVAFPSFGYQEFFSFASRLSSLSSSSASDNPASVLNDLVDFLDSANTWDSSIREKFQDSEGNDNVMEEIGGQQTIAGRWLPLLKDVFENAEGVEGRGLYLAEKGFSVHLESFRAELKKKASAYFTKGKDGKSVLKEGVKAKDAAVAMSTFLYDQANPAVTHFTRSMREAKKVVDLTRGALGVMTGKDKEAIEWRRGVEKEGSTTIRNIAHIPHDERMEELRDIGIDVRAMNKVLWNLQFMENPKNYELSGNFAFEWLPRFESLNRQSGREPFIYGEKDNSKEWLSPSQEDLYLSSDEGADRVTRNLGDDIKIIEDEETGRLYYNRIAKANYNDLIVTDRDAIWDDVRFRSILTGEGQMPMLDDTQGNRVYNDDSQRKAANKVNVSAGIEVTMTALLIGANSSTQTNPNGTQKVNAQAGHQFLYDLIHMDLERKLNAEDIIRERKKYLKPTITVPVTQTSPVTGDVFQVGDEFKEVPLTDDQIERMSEQKLQATFRQAHYYHVIDRAMSGLFKNSNETAISRPRIKALREQFLKEFGDGYSDSVKFLHDVLLFKASFEEATIAKSRVQSEDMISSALSTVEDTMSGDFQSTVDSDESSLIATAIKKWFTSDAIRENHTKEEDKKSTYTADHPIYDGDHVMSLDLGDPILSNLLLLMEGKTILITPTPSQVSRRGLNGIGLRVFPGVNGSPNVVYAPYGVDSRGSEAAKAMTAALTSIARNSPEATERINELADKFNDAIDPVMMAQSIANKFSADVVSFRSDKADSSKNKLEELADFFSQAKETGLYERIHDAIPEGVDRDALDLALDNHFLNASRVARELEATMERSASMSMFPEGERGFITNAMLVAEMFTNPRVKQLLDDVYLGDDLMGGFPALVGEGDLLVPAPIKDTGLIESTEVRIFDQIKSIAGVATGDGKGDFTIEEDAKTAVEEQGQGSEAFDPTIGKAFPKAEAVDKALQDTQDKIGKKSTVKDINDLLRQAAISRGDTYEANRLAVAGDFASDYLMFNFAASLIEDGVRARRESGVNTSPLKQDKSGRDILVDSTDEGANTAIGTKNRKSKGKYSGEWLNILKTVKGKSTWLNINFRNNRIPNMNAAIFYQSSPLISDQVAFDIGQMIDEKLTASVRKGVPEGSNREIDGFPDEKFDPVGIEVILTPEVVEQVRNQLPEGELDRAIKEESKGYKALQKELGEVNSQLLKAEQEKAKVENSEKTRKSMEDFIANKASTLEVRRAVARDLATIFHEHHTLLSEEDGSAAEAASFFASRIGSKFERNSHGMNSIARIGTILNSIDQLAITRDAIAEGKAEFLTQHISLEEQDSKINGQIQAYNHHVDVVNSEIDTALEGAAALSGISFTTKFSPKKIHLKKMEGDTTTITADDVNKLRQSVKKIGDQAKIEKEMKKTINKLLGDQFMGATIGAFSARTAAITKPGAKGAKGKKARMGKFFADAMRFYDARLSGDGVDSLVTFLQNVEEREGHYGVSMNELIGHLALNGDEANILITHGARTVDDVQELMDLENEIKRLTAEDAQIKNHFQQLDDIDNPQSNAIGRTFFVDEVGYVNSEGDLIQVPRNIGIKLSLKPLVDLGEKAEVEDGKLDPIESDHRRMQYLFERNAILKSLEKFSVEYVEDAYNAMKHSGENFGKFDPARLAKNSVSQVKINAEMANQELGRASSEALLADNRGMSAEAMAMLTDPKSKEYDTLTVIQKNKLQRLRMPENFKERAQMFGRYLDVGGEPIILMPTNAKEQLMLSHSKTVNVRNANSQVAEVALAALAVQDPLEHSDALEVGDSDTSFFFEAINNKEALKGKFKSKNRFSLTKGMDGDITKEEAADKFVKKYTDKLTEGLNKIRNHNNKSKDKKFDFTGNNGESALNQAEFAIRQLVLALDHEALAGTLIPNQIIATLESIETEDGNKSFAQVSGETQLDFVRLHELGLTQLLSDTFSAIEGNFISKALSVGLTVKGKGLDHMMMKYVHHHDGRIRNSHRDSYIARQVTRHLSSFLEHGFNNYSGKDQSKTASKLALKRIGEAQEAISNKKVLGVKVQEGDNKNHTMGWLISGLNGLSNAHGQSLSTSFSSWLDVMRLGIQQNRDLMAKQERLKSGKFLESSKLTKATLGRLSKHWNNQNIDLVRDNELTEEVARIIRETEIDKEYAHSTDELNEDQVAALRIERLKKAFMSEVTKGKEPEVQNYADVLTDVFADIDAAMHLTAAITATTKEDTVRKTISSTPIKLSFASDPAGQKQEEGGRHIADPLDHVKILDSSFFGGNITSSHNSKRKGIYRPVVVNGLTAPVSLIEDSIYRLNVAPTYGIMRKVIGRVTLVNGVPQVDPEESGIMKHIEGLKPSDERTSDSYERHKKWYSLMKSTNTSMAIVAGEYETIIQNDFQKGVIKTGGAEVMRVLGSLYTVRALASVQQRWDQTAGPSIGYTMGKIAVGNARTAGMFWNMIGKMLTSSEYRKQIRSFIEKHAPFVFYRAAEGQDVAMDQMKRQKRFGKNHKIKAALGKKVRGLESMGEWALDWSIASGERVLASAIFMAELAQQMNTSDINSILDESLQFTPQQKNNAKTKVNDLMGQSDRSKMNWFFQTRDEHPIANALMRSITRFSTHTTSLASNTSVMSRVLYNGRPDGVSDSNWEANKREAIENVSTSLIQNALFPLLKVKFVVAVVAYAFNLISGDDDDKAARDAQRLSNKLIAVDDEGNAIINLIKTIVFGKQKEAFKLDKDMDVAQANALAEIGSKTITELAATIPIVGAVTGFSPVQSTLSRMFTDDASASLSAAVTGVEASKIGVRQYRQGHVEWAADLMSPTAVLYDYLQAGKLSADYLQTSQFRGDKAVGTYDIVVYLMTEIIPFLREARGQIGSELKEEVKKLPKNR